MKKRTIALGIMGLFILVMLLHGHHEKNQAKKPVTAHDLASGDTNEEVIKSFAKQLNDVQRENQALHQQLLKQTSDSSSKAEIDALMQRIKANEVRFQSLATQSKAIEIQTITQTKGRVLHEIDDMEHRIDGVDSLSNLDRAEIPRKAEAGTKRKVPFYTIPPGTNATHTRLLTSLLGEVPLNGTFEQPPFPFQAIIGREDLLAANGHTLPEAIGGMKITGYSIGVGSFMDNLSCVRAYITQAIYLFNDGHYAVVGQADGVKDQLNPSNTLGYLSDAWGNPCIPGKYITNAPKVIGALTGTGMVSGFGQAMAQAETTTYTGSQEASTLVTGDELTYGLGNGVAYGVNKSADWMLERLKGSFDLVYLSASEEGRPTQVVANFTQEVVIDLDEQGRKWQYAQADVSTVLD